MIFQVKALKALVSVYHFITKLPTLNPFTDAEILFTTTLIHFVFDTYLDKSVSNTRVIHLGANVVPAN